jgi:hypothetical protein
MCDVSALSRRMHKFQQPQLHHHWAIHPLNQSIKHAPPNPNSLINPPKGTSVME